MACTFLQTDLSKHPEVSALLDQLTNHVAWNETLSKEEIETKLLKASYYSYFLTPAEQEGLYVISFLDRDDTVHHHIFRIVPDGRGKLGYKNGAHVVYQVIEDLVASSMGCSLAACSPCE